MTNMEINHIVFETYSTGSHWQNSGFVPKPTIVNAYGIVRYETDELISLVAGYNSFGQDLNPVNIPKKNILKRQKFQVLLEDDTSIIYKPIEVESQSSN